MLSKTGRRRTTPEGNRSWLRRHVPPGEARILLHFQTCVRAQPQPPPAGREAAIFKGGCELMAPQMNLIDFNNVGGSWTFSNGYTNIGSANTAAVLGVPNAATG